MSLLSLTTLLRPAAAAAVSACRAAVSSPVCPVPLRSPVPCRFAGHSRWQNVKGDKDAGNAQKQVASNYILRLLQKAVQQGGGSTNPVNNAHLKAVYDKARSENIPLKMLERALNSKSCDVVDPYVVEVRGRGGLCVLVQSQSAAKVKCRQSVASFAKKLGLEVVGIDSQVSRNFFNKKGRIEALQDPQKLATLDRATELAVELDCSDVRLETGGDGGADGCFVFDCDPTAVTSVTDGLVAAGVDVIDSGVFYVAIETVEVDADTVVLLHELYDKLRDNVEGVVQVFDNISVA